MELKDFCFTGQKPDLKKFPQNAFDLGHKKEDKEGFVEKTSENVLKIARLQDKLYADAREGVIVALQAMDAAGKDGTIKHVFSGVNPQGVTVVSFKQPSALELSHDYLWRMNQALPGKGHIAVWNRSHYEDVLVTRIHGMEQKYLMAKRCLKGGAEEFYKKRIRQICDYERYLYENSFRMVKFFLNISQEEQKRRFEERINDPAKNWKFSAGDLHERSLWKEYRNLYEEIIEQTGKPHSPWYIIPADQKWYARFLVSEIVKKTLEDCEPEYPVVGEADLKEMQKCKLMLEKE